MVIDHFEISFKKSIWEFYIKDSSIILNFNLFKKIAIILDKCFDYDK